MNYLKAVFFGCLFFSVTVMAGYGAYSYVYYDDLLIECTEKAYKNGYQIGFLTGKDNVEKIVRHEYQNIISSLMEEKYDRKDVRQQILMERRLDRIMEKSNKKLSDSKKALFKQYIMKWANEYELSPVFVASIIHRETNFNEKAISKSNARGAMQVLYKYHKDKCDKLGIKEQDLHTINHGINVGCQVIRQYLEWNNWNYRAALKKYVGAVNNSADGYIDDIFKMTMYAYEE
jgi:hypothetical protein